MSWDIRKSFEIEPAYKHWRKGSIGVVWPSWAHKKIERREATLLINLGENYGVTDLETAKRISNALIEAIALASTLKLENPKKVKP